MLEAIRNLFGMQPKTDFSALINAGAVILDVRSGAEFHGGHIPGALNIPVEQLKNNIHGFSDKSKPVITCCASGIRSASAKAVLISCGFKKVYNGGGWMGLQKKLK